MVEVGSSGRASSVASVAFAVSAIGVASSIDVALSSEMAFSTSSCGVGCNSEIGGSSSFSAASLDAHLCWNRAEIDDGLICSDEREERDVIVRDLQAKEDGEDERTRRALRRRCNLCLSVDHSSIQFQHSHLDV